MRIRVAMTVEADVDGWRETTGAESAAHALLEILAYLRSLNPVDGQSFLTIDGSPTATIDLSL